MEDDDWENINPQPELYDEEEIRELDNTTKLSDKQIFALVNAALGLPPDAKEFLSDAEYFDRHKRYRDGSVPISHLSREIHKGTELTDAEFYYIYQRYRDGSRDISFPVFDGKWRIPTLDPPPGWWESWLAANTSSSLGQAVRKTLLAWKFREERDAEFRDEDIDISGYEEHAKYLYNSSSHAEVVAKKHLLDDIRYEQYQASHGHGIIQSLVNGIANIDTVPIVLLLIAGIFRTLKLIKTGLKKIVIRLTPFAIVFLVLVSFRSSFFISKYSALETLFGTVDTHYVWLFYLLRVLVVLTVVHCFKKQKFRMYCVKHRFSMLGTFAFCVPLFWDFGMLLTVNFFGFLAIEVSLFEIYLRYQQK